MTEPSPQITLILLTIAICPVLNFKPAPISHQASPEIWLAAYSEVDSYRGVPPDDGFRLQHQFKNDFISKNGSDYIVYEDVYSVVFACEAEYPITWAFPHPQMEHLENHNYEFKEYRSSSFTEEQKTPKNVNFKIVLTLQSSYRRGVDFLSLNVTCSSTSTPHIQSSVYVFQMGQQSIENEGETLEVYLEPSPPASGIAPPRPDRYLGPPLILPCRPASPEIKLLLEKQVVTKAHPTKQQVWKPLQNPTSQKYITFDPKIGFTVGRGLFYGNKIYGMYRCSVLISNDDDDDKVDGSTGDNVDSNQYVLVNVTNNRNNSDGYEEIIPFEPKSILRGPATFHLEWGLNTEANALCCSGVPDQPPKLYRFICSDELHCQFLKNQIPEDIEEKEENEGKAIHIIKRNDPYNDSSDCSREYLYGEKMFVVCHGQNIDFAEEYINVFRSEAQGPIVNRSMRIQDEEEKEGEYTLQESSSDRIFFSLTHYTALSSYDTHTDGLIPSQKMFVTVGKFARPKEIEIWREKGLIGPSLLYRIHLPKRKRKESSTVASDDDFEDLDLFEDIDDFQDYDSIPIRKRSLEIMEYVRDVYYTGETLNFMCFGLSYFYATPSRNEGGGAYLRLNWENGTKQILDTSLKQSTSKRKKAKMLYRIVYLSDGADIASGQSHQIIPLFSTSLKAQKGMDSVDCWMAQRNSSDWDTVSRKIKVEDSVAPKFQEGEAEETVYFYLGEVGHRVTCVVIDAKPFPSYLKVTKDGKSLNLNINKDNADKGKKDDTTSEHEPTESKTGSEETEKIDEVKDIISINIGFSVIKHDMQGVYQCTAKNVNGTAIRTIHVFVLQKRGLALPISLGIAGVLCLVFGGLALKHWRDKKTVQSLRTNIL